MEKIVIIGSPGAGKTTLAKELHSMLKIKVFHLDRLFWQRGWKGKTRDTRIGIMDNLVLEKGWIIEGTYLSSSEPRLYTADTIIFLDIPPLLCLWRIIKRHRKYHGRSLRDIPEGCTDKLTLLRMLKVLAFPFRGRRTLKQKLRNYKSKQIIWLRSGKEIKDFLAQLEPGADDRGPLPVTHYNSQRETYDLSMLWCMRWFALIIITIGFLSTIAASIAIILIVKNPLPLAIPSSLALLLRPVIRWLFPPDQHNNRRAPH
jgi:adenylate kinase family enzyme